MCLNESEGERLEALAFFPWAYSPGANHPVEGWL